jgi:hypothetical protein
LIQGYTFIGKYLVPLPSGRGYHRTVFERKNWKWKKRIKCEEKEERGKETNETWKMKSTKGKFRQNREKKDKKSP